MIQAAHQSIGQQLMCINNEWIPATGEAFLSVENPARKGTEAGQVPRGGKVDVDEAVKAAARAFPAWRNTPARERGRAMLAIAGDMESQLEDFARLYTLETGSAIATQSRGEAAAAADLLRYFGGVASEIKGETVPLGENLFSYTRREPLGVVGGIVPWNAPLILSALKISMALTAGNTLVLKPSAEAPLTAVKLVKCCSRHLPPGVLNLVTGTGEECGRPLLEHPGIAKLSFTGSTEVGRAVMQAGAERIIPVSLELGGKNPQIVYPDADDEHTVQQVINAMRFVRQGQSCTAGSRLFLHASIFEDFLDRLCEQLKGLRIGDPFEESTQVGAMVNRIQFEKVCASIRDGLEKPGAQVLCGGLPPESGPLAKGYFLEPTLFTGVANHWRLAREEVFGPVLTAHPWTTEEEVVAMANDSHFGLSAFLYSRDINAALRTAHALESGFVQINQGAGIVPGQSYGGFKQSGIGREWSLEGMLESFTQRKSVTVNLA